MVPNFRFSKTVVPIANRPDAFIITDRKGTQPLVPDSLTSTSRDGWFGTKWGQLISGLRFLHFKFVHRGGSKLQDVCNVGFTGLK